MVPVLSVKNDSTAGLTYVHALVEPMYPNAPLTDSLSLSINAPQYVLSALVIPGFGGTSSVK